MGGGMPGFVEGERVVTSSGAVPQLRCSNDSDLLRVGRLAPLKDRNHVPVTDSPEPVLQPPPSVKEPVNLLLGRDSSMFPWQVSPQRAASPALSCGTALS
jgi:hypothetical protein